MLRIGLFLSTNLAVMVVLGIVMSILGRIFGFSPGSGMSSLFIYSAVLGFVGALVSLFMSKRSAIKSMNVQLIDAPANDTEKWLVSTVAAQAEQAGIDMPDVGIFNARESNAFATGWNKNNALVAVSTGLMNEMSQNEVEAVLAHEVSHVANGDMVTMTLLQGVMNTFVYFLASLAARAVSGAMRERGAGAGGSMVYYAVRTVAQIGLGFLANVIVMWFSRRREYRADEGGAALAGRENMVSALQRLGGSNDAVEMPAKMQAFGIRSASIKKLGMTHPAIEDRISALSKNA